MKTNYKEMVEIIASVVNPKHQYRVSQCGEHDLVPITKKNRDYFEHPGLTHFMNEH